MALQHGETAVRAAAEPLRWPPVPGPSGRSCPAADLVRGPAPGKTGLAGGACRRIGPLPAPSPARIYSLCLGIAPETKLGRRSICAQLRLFRAPAFLPARQHGPAAGRRDLSVGAAPPGCRCADAETSPAPRSPEMRCKRPGARCRSPSPRRVARRAGRRAILDEVARRSPEAPGPARRPAIRFEAGGPAWHPADPPRPDLPAKRRTRA